MSTYAWVVDKDHLAEPGDEPGTYANASGVTGPSDAPEELLARLTDGAGEKFRMYDGDAILYYEGRVVHAEEDGHHGNTEETAALGPLWDFGTGNAGCTEIRYQENGQWVTL